MAKWDGLGGFSFSHAGKACGFKQNELDFLFITSSLDKVVRGRLVLVSHRSCKRKSRKLP